MLKKLLIVLYLCIVVLLGTATFVEHSLGTAFVEKNIYHSGWFCGLWALLSVLTVVVGVRLQLWKRWAVMLLHVSFLVILAGAMTTFLFAKKGYVHLQPHQPVNSFTDMDNQQMYPLPFRLELDSFRVRYYPGTEAPADYISYLRHDGRPVRVSMNRIFEHEGYRFYQSSFDEQGEGSWLSVNYDPWGIALTYTGYVMLALSMLAVLLSRKGEFMRLLRHPLLRKGGMLVVAVLAAAPAFSAGRTLPAFSRDKADSLATRQVIYNDRVVPFNTLARDFVLKITGKPTYFGLTPEQVVSGWMLRPEVWQHEPMIYIKSGELRHLLDVKGEYARLTDLFDGQTYRLQQYWKPGNALQQQSSLQKAVSETDEKVGLILMLQKGTLIRPLPEDGSVQPLSESKVQAELLYNRVPFTKCLFMANLALGLLAFSWFVYQNMNKNRKWQGMGRVFICLLYVSLAFQLFSYVLRWYIAGRVPLANGYETMQFMALCALFFSALLHRRFAVMLPFGFLLSGFALLVSYLGQMNPQITPLMPVLISPWLSTHVSFIMMSYALLAFILLDGVLAFCLPHRQEMLMLLSRLLLYPAVFFLGIGIFLGAVWANQSWGRYWAWDPKEVWALITFMVYGIAFHAQSLPLLRRPRVFHGLMIIAFLTVLMTYFGVNYFLGGMHSYANA